MTEFKDKLRVGSRIGRSELYGLIWSELTKDVAPRLGMSPEQLGTAWEATNIPRPDRGYWNHVNPRPKAKKAALPNRQPGQAGYVELIVESRMVSAVRRRMFRDGPPLVMPVFPDDRAVIESRAHALAATAPIRKTHSRIHREISKLLARDERRKAIICIALAPFLVCHLTPHRNHFLNA